MKPTGDGEDREFDRLLSRAVPRMAGTRAEDCPQAEVLSAAFDHALPEAEAAAVHAHVARCARCQQVLGHLARTEPEVLYVHPRPEPKPWTWHLRWAVPVAAAATVVFVVGTRQLIAPDAGPAPRSAAAPAGQVAQKAAAELDAAPSEPMTRTLTAPSSEPPSAPGREPPVAAPLGKPVAQAPARSEPLAGTATPPREKRLAKEGAAQVGLALPALPPPPAATPVAAPPAMRAAPGPITTQAAASGGTASELRKAESTRADTLAVMETAPALSAFVPGGAAGWRYARPGFVLRTLDGGTEWTEQRLPVGARLLALSAVSAELCWAAGRGGLILRTADGATWQTVTSPTRSDIRSIAALDDQRATIQTVDGLTFDTGDAGATWRRR